MERRQILKKQIKKKQRNIKSTDKLKEKTLRINKLNIKTILYFVNTNNKNNRLS